MANSGKPLSIFAPALFTERLTLTLFDPSNLSERDHVLACYNDPNAIQAMGDFQLRKHDHLLTHCKQLRLRAEDCGGKSFGEVAPCYLIRLGPQNSRGKTVGIVGMASDVTRSGRSPDMGWLLLSEYSGRGYATEAGKRARDYWTTEVGIRELHATIRPQNEKSVAVALRLGFEKALEGVNENGKLDFVYKKVDR